MPTRSTGLLLLLGLFVFVLQPGRDASATALTAGGFHQFEDHSSGNHSNETLDAIDLSFGSLANTNVKNSSFVDAIFEQTDFSGANLQGADLTNANLENAIFSNASNLKNADLAGANLVGVDLTGVNVQNSIFTGAFYDATTVVPFDPVAAGMVVVPELSPFTMILIGLLCLSGMRGTSVQRLVVDGETAMELGA